VLTVSEFTGSFLEIFEKTGPRKADLDNLILFKGVYFLIAVMEFS
jgi:hypothetical protein